jgi:two-component system, NtrC family, sensor kinase
MHKKTTVSRKCATNEEIYFLEAFNKSVLDSISDAILVIDPDNFKIIEINRAGLRQLDRLKEDVVGHLCYEVTHHRSTPCEPPNDICPILDLFKTGESVTVEHTHFNKENKKFYVEVSVHPIRNRDGKISLITHIAKDITERKLMQAKLLDSERLATVGDLALTLANDLRNPLQAIQVASYWLKKDYSRLQSSSKGVEMLQCISNSIKYSDNIIKAMLDFASSKNPIIKKLDVNTVVKKVLGQVEIPKEVELKTELGILPQIEADEDMLEKVFIHIIQNGLAAMEKGGTLKASTLETAEFVEVSFRDTGIGIPKGNLEKLFKPLFTTKSKGMGLGLAISKRLVEAHKGSIVVESEEGKGTEVKIKLPIHSSVMKNQNFVNSNILVVDDDFDRRDSFEKAHRALKGYE